MCFGSGGGGNQTITHGWLPFIENMWGGDGKGNPGLLNRAVDTLNKPYQQYGGQRIAGFTPDQGYGMDRIRNVALHGTDSANASDRKIIDVLGGNATNKYAGDNPYFRDVVKQGMGDITDAYKQGTSADTTRMFNLSGAFGGSAHQNAVKNNEGALAGQLQRYQSGMANQQYDRSAGLEEANLGRQMSAIPMGFQAENRAFNTGQQLLGIGGQQQNQNQRGYDQDYNDWTQAQNWERNNLGWMANLLSQASGGTGQTQQSGGYSGINPVGGLLGGAAFGNAMGWWGK